MDISDKLVSTIKGRVMELRVMLKHTTKASERFSIQQAIAINCAWLLSLGISLCIPEIEEV